MANASPCGDGFAQRASRRVVIGRGARSRRASVVRDRVLPCSWRSSYREKCRENGSFLSGFGDPREK
jgi:hypothetical protein